ncbi:hypothetical protein [Thermostaphylospora chromogena]|uniref:Uncharacterized protein n=1 Tax=Thermostaphylospora chromogena TaxID=35622 RepID=A0A1H1BJ63_9ACTN|nr:hypothetical protein [Thermostaphylospora chromogena]SDQ52025.1 hypothetical protein SAMN04489764_0994 [Thermostaphylospora chromogena]
MLRLDPAALTRVLIRMGGLRRGGLTWRGIQAIILWWPWHRGGRAIRLGRWSGRTRRGR